MIRKRAFTLIEIIIAITIFSLIIVWLISIINNINTERKISLEKSKINENFVLFEKNLKDILNAADLSIDSGTVNFPSISVDIITPINVPTAVLSPSIYNVTPTNTLVAYRRGRPVDPFIAQLITIFSQGNRILFTVNNQRTRETDPPILNLAVLSNMNTGIGNFIFYFEPILGRPPLNTTIQVIDFGTPIVQPTGGYQVAVRFWRNSIVDNSGNISPGYQQLIYQLAGNASNISSLQFRIRQMNVESIRVIGLYDPIMINSEIRVGVYDNRGRRRFLYNRVLNIPLKYKSVI